MPRYDTRLPLLLALVLGCACAAGSDDGLTGFSGGYTAGPAEGGDATESSTGGTGGSAEGPGTMGESADATGGGTGVDVGSPQCCEVGVQAGCGSMVTEACVCTSQPSCCQAVWAQDCVDLAIACGDPYCDGAPGTDEGPGTDTGVELECDPGFAFMPGNPAPGVAFDATFSDPVGFTWVGLSAEGPGGAVIPGEWGGVTGSGPYTWSYGYAGLAAGVWTFSFTSRDSENGPDIVRATCDKQL